MIEATIAMTGFQQVAMIFAMIAQGMIQLGQTWTTPEEAK